MVKKANAKKAAARAANPPAPPARARARRTHPGGKPEHVPTERDRTLVLCGAACGFTQERLAAMIGISKETLAKHYAEQIGPGADQMLANVAGNMFRIATQRVDNKAAVSAGMQILKSRLPEWRDKAPAVDGTFKSTKGSDGQEEMVFTLRIGERDASDA